MKALQTKIKYLKANINRNNQRIGRDYYHLQHAFKPSTLLWLEIGGGFIAGYLLARKKTTFKVITTAAAFALKINKFQRRIKLFLPFLP